MQSPFDKIAPVYDELFTNTAIGKMQRNIIYNYMDESLSTNQQINILELNCGTGEDAVYFAKKGFGVVATDVSEEMLKITEEKINKLKKDIDSKLEEEKKVRKTSEKKMWLKDLKELEDAYPKWLKMMDKEKMKKKKK